MQEEPVLLSIANSSRAEDDGTVCFWCLYFQAPSWLIAVVRQHRIARPVSQGGSVLSTVRAPQRACVKRDGFAQRALYLVSAQVGIFGVILYLKEL